MQKAIVFILLVMVNGLTGVTFSRCSLVRVLETQGFHREQLPDWVCLIEHESARNTSAVGGPNKNGSFDYGLFQINDGYWCKTEGCGGDCNINCNNLIDDNITDDVKCVRKIYKRHGFSAWNAWKKHCKDKTLPDLSKCFK